MKRELIKTWQNGLKTCKAVNPQFFKQASNNNLNLLFTNNGNEVEMGIDSHYKFQINSSNFENKTDLINFINEEIKRIKE